LSNSGDLKYKEGNITYFSRSPLSIVNPFKKKKLLDKIRDYCNSIEFDKYYEHKNYQSIKHIDFYNFKKLSLEKFLTISAIKNEDNSMLVLVSKKTDRDIELIFIIDNLTDKVIGYY